MEKEEILISVTELENQEYDIGVSVKKPISADTLIMVVLRMVRLTTESTNITVEEIVQMIEKDEFYN